ncbi:MAG: TonB-dependent receptor [Cytophagales bacterium]|nr:TonB-dependent receptor [Cytophagales bacterium]
MNHSIKLRFLFAIATAFLVISLLSSIASKAAELHQTIRGTITDQDSKSPVIGANIVVVNSEPLLGASTDARGNFRIEQVPVGRVSLRISCIGYEEKVIPNLLISSAKEFILNIDLTESMVKMEELVITALEQNKNEVLNEMAVVSARQFSVEETKRYAGAFNDPARMVSAFAGNNTAAEGNNFIIVRGNSPKGIQWRLDGIEIPNPNHFADEGSTGGAINALNSAMLTNSDFFSGAFPAEYGNAFSGVFDMRLRNGNNENREYAFSAGLLGTDITLEGPIKKGGGASYLVNYRYSTLAILDDLNIVEFDGVGVSKYQDLSFKLRFPTRNAGTFSFFGLGGKSHILEDTRDEENEDLILSRGDWKADMGVMALGHRYLFGNRTYLESNVSIARSGTGGIGEELGDHNEFYTDFDGFFRNHTAKITSILHHKFSAKNKIQLGFIYDRKFYDYYSDVYYKEEGGLVREQDSKGDTGLYNVFASWKYRLFEEFTAISGLHVMGTGLNSNLAVEPRFGLQWTFSPTQTLSAAFGVHSKMESLINYFAVNTDDDGNEHMPNKNLDFSKARHYVLGYSNMLTGNLLLKLEAYYQDLYNIPVEDDPNSSYSLINSVEGYTTRNLINEGTGYNYGLELTLERYFANSYYYMLSTSLFESKYKALDGIERNSRFNVNYLGNLLFGKEFSMTHRSDKDKVLSISTKFSIAGGRWYTPIDLEASRAAGHTERVEALAFTERGDDIFTGNLAIAYRINNKRTSQELKLDIQNFTNNAAKLDQWYNSTTDKIEFSEQLPLLPILMYTIQF